jgi:hypothetical protein
MVSYVFSSCSISAHIYVFVCCYFVSQLTVIVENEKKNVRMRKGKKKKKKKKKKVLSAVGYLFHF